ncbi:MAG: hydroxyethylthiazole kinase [Paracoccus sp. (in: a-proteobacteria)]
MTQWGQHLRQMRDAAPLVQCITNFVAMNVAANVLLAAGASPAMIHDEAEAGEFAAIADALSINIGTLSPDWLRGMLAAAEAANRARHPWVLDPVAVGATGFRRDSAARLLALRPAVIRGNASEILALAGAHTRGKGADSTDSVSLAESGARMLASRTGGVVAVTGPVDFVTDGTRSYRIANGHPLMPRVTAFGCALTCLNGAFIAGQPHLEGTVATLAAFGIAGEVAGAEANGPGRFAPAFIDALAALSPGMVDERARVTPA